MLKGFKEFISRGNVMDLAVAVVIGAAFTAIVDAVVKGFLTPFIAAIFGEPSLRDVGNFTINNAEFSFGLILDAILNFLIVAAAVYFFLVMPMNKLAERKARGQEVEPDPLTVDQVLLTEIRDSLRTPRQ